MKRYLLVASCLLLGACSSHDGSSSTPKAKKVFTKAYSMKINGCATGEQTFTSEVSEDEAVDKLCAGLADSKRNNGCAEAERRNVFEVTCKNMDWNTLVARAAQAQTPTPQPSPQPAPAPRPMPRKLYSLNLQPGSLLVESVELVPGLSAEAEKRATDLAADLNSCGFNHFGPNCLVKLPSSRAEIVQLGENLYSSEFTSQDSQVVTMILHTEQKAQSLKVLTVDVIWGAERGIKLFTVKVAADREAQLRKNLTNPSDLRMLYHAGRDVHDDKLVSSAYTQNRRLITQSTQVVYQEAILPELRKHVAPESLLEISEALLGSTSESVRQLAAINVMKAQPNRTELKPVVVAALGSVKWSIRLGATETLAAVPLNASEKDLLIGMIRDQDSDVAKVARQGTAALEITPENFEAVEKLAAAPAYSARVSAMELLGRLGTPKGIRLLIKKLDDPDSDVAKAANDNLNKFPLDAEYVPDLKTALKSPSYHTRVAVVEALGRIGDESASLALIDGFKGENDSDVQRALGRALEMRTITDADVIALERNFGHLSYHVRLQIAHLLTKNQGYLADLALIRRLAIDSDSDVQKAIAEALFARPLKARVVDDLEKVFAAQSYTVRVATAQLLGKIGTAEAKAALKKQLAKESDSDVKRAIQNALGGS